MYSFILSLKRVRNSLSRYWLIIIEIAIGIAVLILSSTLLSSINNKFDEIHKDRRNRMYYLTGASYLDNNFVSTNSGAIAPEFGTIEDYDYVKTKYQNLVQPLLYKLFTKPANIDGESKDILIFYATPEFMELVLNDTDNKLDDDQIYVGKEAFRAIEEGLFVDFSAFIESYERFENYDKDTNKVTLLGGRGLHVNQYLPKEKNILLYSFFSIEEIDFDYTIVLPISSYNEENSDGYQINTFGLEFVEDDSNLKLDILDYFIEKYSDDSSYEYSYLSVLSIYDANVYKFREIGEVLKIISTFALIMVTGGLFAYNLMEFNKRKREISIKKSIGCNDGQILFECTLESCLVTISGGILGSILGVAIVNLDLFISEFFTVKLDYLLIFTYTLSSILIGVVTNLYVSWQIRKLKPVQILKEL